MKSCGITEHFIAEKFSSMVVLKKKGTVEAYLCMRVKMGHSGGSQCQATDETGRIASRNAMRIINEPKAATSVCVIKRREGRLMVVPRCVWVWLSFYFY